MSEIIKSATIRNYEFWVCLITSVALTVIGFFMPPKGIIDSSVLYASSLLLAFATLGVVWHSVKLGVDAKFKHGKTEVTIGDLNNE